MTVNAASRTNEKLYQARQLLQLLASSGSAAPSLRNGLLNSAVFALHGAYLAFLLEIAVAHRVKARFIDSLQQLSPLLEKQGIVDLAVRELQQLTAAGDWPALLFDWYRAALGDDGWKPASDKPASEERGNIIEVVEVGTSGKAAATAAGVLDVLEKLRIFIDEQREHLFEW